jgi:serine/threonine protein kinase
MRKPPRLGESGDAGGSANDPAATVMDSAHTHDATRASVSIIDVRLVTTRTSVTEKESAAQSSATYGGLANSAAALPAEIGTILRDRYELHSIIGAGSMGVVYRALDHLHEEMQDSDPYVAIKILNERLKDNHAALMALQQETRRAQTLAHENIVIVHNFDRDESHVFMTMELLDGQSLKTLVAERAGSGLAPGQVVPIVYGVARALAYAHGNGIVHCDLKPANVYLTDRQRVKVLDFGVARAFPLPTDRPKDRGPIVGMTPAYASPQMLAGEEAMPSDDVFSLGVMALELVRGRHPFDGGPPDAARLGRLDSSAFNGFAHSHKHALARALAHDREARQQDASEFLKEFEGTSPLRVVAWSSLAAAVLLSVTTLYMSTREVDVQPAIPFAELPAAVQAQVNSAIREGDMALTFGNAAINEAFQYFSDAYSLHPNNERANAGLETVADRFLDSLEGADAATQRNVFSLLLCQEHLARYAPVMRACDTFFDGARCADIVSSCSVSED